eukprot:TRINITY_DN354_c0_g1_i1.p3 TRINITY_DN354_c0_g1~~TRINITY_DN354_c0_g1_i1.p3  ORF type:complete len:345 (+),score=56.34 TRINITY_DN354_c0_g1_i1:671-1705(+)
MKPNKTTCATCVLTIVLSVTIALPISEIPERHSKKLYPTSDTPHLLEDPDTREVLHTRSNGFKQYKTAHEHHDMGADDLKRAARQSRREQDTSREQQPSAPRWLTSFTKFFGIGISNEDNENGTGDEATDEKSIERSTHHEEPVPFKQNVDVDPLHPADYGIEEEVGDVQTSLMEPDSEAERDSNELVLDDDELLSKTDLQDLVRLFRRMFTTLEKELNQTKALVQPPQLSSANSDLNAALAQAHALNRRKELERERKKGLLHGSEEEVEREDEDGDHDHRLEVPMGSPAYESRKRITRGLNGVVDKDRVIRRRAVRRSRQRSNKGSAREHFSQAMSAGLLPYL